MMGCSLITCKQVLSIGRLKTIRIRSLTSTGTFSTYGVVYVYDYHSSLNVNAPKGGQLISNPTRAKDPTGNCNHVLYSCRLRMTTGHNDHEVVVRMVHIRDVPQINHHRAGCSRGSHSDHRPRNIGPGRSGLARQVWRRNRWRWRPMRINIMKVRFHIRKSEAEKSTFSLG